MKKIRVGIDINETLRAKWVQFDKFYVEEFGEEGVPDKPYSYNYFTDYKWESKEETIKELKEPEDFPENINPLDYQKENNDESPADFALFKKPNNIKLSAKDVFNRFMYEDFLFEIHGSAPMIYRGVDLDFTKIYTTFNRCVDFKIVSVENKLSIPPTLFFLSKVNSRFNKYLFVDKLVDVWDDIDILITTDPEIFNNKKPKSKKIIKIIRPYNENIKNNVDIETNELINLIENDDFKKIIKYK